MYLSSVLWQKMLLQSLAVFSILLGLGLGLLALTVLWTARSSEGRATRRRAVRPHVNSNWPSGYFCQASPASRSPSSEGQSILRDD